MKQDTTIPTKPSWLDEGQTLRCLTPADRAKHKAMSDIIYEALPSKELLIPMTEEEYDDTCREENCDVMYGIFEGDTLIATSSLLHDVRAYAANPELHEVLQHPCVEIGECMVLPEYRGRNLMLRLNELVKAEALRQGMHYMLATAHPDNIASNSSLCRLGYHIVKEFTRAGKRRNLLLMEL
ncbi:MAG: GNAT family N-acetyltransferase [Bacteroidales bacterium]|nr:GNAT family N-acetyltransferase [Bacteroidales bacterium]